MNKFLSAVSSVLEVDAITIDDEFRMVPGWCSLKGFGLLVMMENDWATRISINHFLELKTVRDLYREAMVSFVASIIGVDREVARNASYGSVPEWDSVSHLRIVMEAERRFGTYYPIETIPSIRTIEDLLQ